MKNLSFSGCKSREDIEATIKAALEYDTVADSDDAAEQWFKDAGFDGDVTNRVCVSTAVSIWNEKEQGEEEYNVVVKEHFVDSGSDDYVYSYSILN